MLSCGLYFIGAEVLVHNCTRVNTVVTCTSLKSRWNQHLWLRPSQTPVQRGCWRCFLQDKSKQVGVILTLTFTFMFTFNIARKVEKKNSWQWSRCNNNTGRPFNYKSLATLLRSSPSEKSKCTFKPKQTKTKRRALESSSGQKKKARKKKKNKAIATAH